MSTDYVSIETVGIETVLRAMHSYPDITYKYVGTEFKRGANRFRTKLIKNWGIHWSGKKKVGGNVRAIVEGNDLNTLAARIQLSSFLSKHETGGEIKSENGFLAVALRKDLPNKPSAIHTKLFVLVKNGQAYLAAKVDPKESGGAFRDAGGKFVSTKGGVMLLYKLVKSVQMKPKLGMRTMWDAYTPDFIKRINAAVDRAAQVTFDSNVRIVSGAFQKAVG